MATDAGQNGARGVDREPAQFYNSVTTCTFGRRRPRWLVRWRQAGCSAAVKIEISTGHSNQDGAAVGAPGSDRHSTWKSHPVAPLQIPTKLDMRVSAKLRSGRIFT